MRDLDEDKKLKGRSSENRLSNGGCLVDCGLHQVSGIRYQGKGKGKGMGKGKGKGMGKGKGKARGGTSWSCGNEVDGIEIVGIMIMPSGMR